MFIVKNAFKSIIRTKGRNILIGIIVVTVIAASCISLSIKNAAQTAKESGLQGKTITATIGIDREKLMQEAQNGASTDSSASTSARGAMMQALQIPELGLADNQTLAALTEVSGYYFSDSATLGKISGDSDEGDGNIQPVVATDDTTSNADSGRRFRMSGTAGDFSVTGFSSDAALQNTANGAFTMQSGQMTDNYEEANYEAIITSDLATFNGLEIGDTINITNPNNSAETYSFKVSGIYKNNTSADSTTQAGPFNSSDPSNAIYVNYPTIQDIINKSKASKIDVKEDQLTRAPGAAGGPGGVAGPMGGPNGSSNGFTTTTLEYGSSEFTSRVSFTYLFDSVDSYKQFASNYTSAKLSDTSIDLSKFKVTSADVDNFEASLVPLENLSKFATTLLWIILLVGAIILIVLNLFNIRERKYEIGVYTAMGIKKPKVIGQFAVELLIVTLVSVGIGAGIGAGASVPVANAMLSGQVSQVESEKTSETAQFGRNGAPAAGGPAPTIAVRGGVAFGGETAEPVNYIEQINSALDFKILAQLLGIGVLLSLISSIGGATFVSRYEPLQILADRA